MDNCKLRLKAPSGAEFEAEGPADFIQSERNRFLESMLTGKARPQQQNEEKQSPAPEATQGQSAEFWNKIVTTKAGVLHLRLKAPDVAASEAALTLLAAHKALGKSEDLSAITLSRALRSSGYQPDRIDRLLGKEIKAGKATASGTKRNRTYRITQKGLAAIYETIHKLTARA